MKKIHIICGMCGCETILSFQVRKEINDDTGEYINVVYIHCENCSTLTGLDETIKQEENEEL